MHKMIYIINTDELFLILVFTAIVLVFYKGE